MSVHKHQCRRCQIVWEHESACAGNSEAHTCPTPGCGQEEREYYEGEQPASYVTDCATNQHAAVSVALT